MATGRREGERQAGKLRGERTMILPYGCREGIGLSNVGLAWCVLCADCFALSSSGRCGGGGESSGRCKGLGCVLWVR